MDKLTPFVPITERVLDEDHQVTWRERFSKAIEFYRPGLKKLHYDTLQEAIDVVVQEDMNKEYDFPCAPNIILPKLGGPIHDNFLRNILGYGPQNL